jgi:hypothetical protein
MPETLDSFSHELSLDAVQWTFVHVSYSHSQFQWAVFLHLALHLMLCRWCVWGWQRSISEEWNITAPSCWVSPTSL